MLKIMEWFFFLSLVYQKKGVVESFINLEC